MLYQRLKIKDQKLKSNTGNFSPVSYKLQTTSCFGFTFIELIIVISIFAVLSSVVMFNFTDFSSNVKLQNLVQDVALQVRQAQLSGSSGRIPPQSENNPGILLNFTNGTKPAYGVHFNFNRNDEFIYFADFDFLSGIYSVSTLSCSPIDFPQNECIDVLELPDEFIISELEVVDTNGPHLASNNDFDAIDIVFTRPQLEAQITAHADNTNVISGIGAIIEAKITLKSSRGQKRTVTVSRIGQISAQ